MRRPLFGNGFPKVIPNNVDLVANPDQAKQILDLRNQPADVQQRFFFLTLYAYFSTAAADAELQVAQQNGSDTPISVVTVELPAASPAWAYAVPVLERFPVRGPQRIVASNVGADLSTAIYLFGYLELEETDIPDPQGLRGLQIANNPVKPFLSGARKLPVQVNPHVLHQLNGGYIDEITLDLYVSAGGVEFGSAGSLNLSGTSESLPLVELGLPAGAPYNSLNRLFAGIPMMSSGALTLSVPTVDAIAVGTFKRY
jgi:hypothetical protein